MFLKDSPPICTQPLWTTFGVVGSAFFNFAKANYSSLDKDLFASSWLSSFLSPDPSLADDNTLLFVSLANTDFLCYSLFLFLN